MNILLFIALAANGLASAYSGLCHEYDRASWHIGVAIFCGQAMSVLRDRRGP